MQMRTRKYSSNMKDFPKLLAVNPLWDESSVLPKNCSIFQPAIFKAASTISQNFQETYRKKGGTKALLNARMLLRTFFCYRRTTWWKRGPALNQSCNKIQRNGQQDEDGGIKRRVEQKSVSYAAVENFAFWCMKIFSKLCNRAELADF